MGNSIGSADELEGADFAVAKQEVKAELETGEQSNFVSKVKGYNDSNDRGEGSSR